MSTELRNKKKELKAKLLEVAALQEQIAHLSLAESSKDSIHERFPIGSKIRLTGKNKKPSLRKKTATVIGHTTCYVKLERRGESFRRAPENVTLVEGNECQEEAR